MTVIAKILELKDFAKSKAYSAAFSECSEPSIATIILENFGCDSAVDEDNLYYVWQHRRHYKKESLGFSTYGLVTKNKKRISDASVSNSRIRLILWFK